MRLVLRFKNLETKRIIEMVMGECGGEHKSFLKAEDVADQVLLFLSEEANASDGIRLAKNIGLEIPRSWYGLGLKKSVEVGNLESALEFCEKLERGLTQKEISHLVEMTILKGDMVTFYNIEKFSSQVFNLVSWQNIFLIRIVRMLWEKKYSSRSPIGLLESFATDFSEIFSDFSIETNEVVCFPLIKCSFCLFNKATMSQLLFVQSKLGDDPFVKYLSRGITRFSPE